MRISRAKNVVEAVELWQKVQTELLRWSVPFAQRLSKDGEVTYCCPTCGTAFFHVTLWTSITYKFPIICCGKLLQ